MPGWINPEISISAVDVDLAESCSCSATAMASVTTAGRAIIFSLQTAESDVRRQLRAGMTLTSRLTWLWYPGGGSF